MSATENLKSRILAAATSTQIRSFTFYLNAARKERSVQIHRRRCIRISKRGVTFGVVARSN